MMIVGLGEVRESIGSLRDRMDYYFLREYYSGLITPP